jgi:cytochrome c553
MKKKWLKLSLAIVFIGTSGILHAESSNGVKHKPVACESCHGENGNSTISMYPKLAGQHASYLVKELQAFKNGMRKDPMMSPMAMDLSDEHMAEIADYFSEQKITTNSLPVVKDGEEDFTGKVLDKDSDKNAALQVYITQGSDLYRNGDLTRAVSACIACHGSLGEGNKPAAFPVLHSQHADYIIKTLTDFKTGTRSTNPENIMRMIAKKMTYAEIRAVAYYISTMK